MKIDFSIVSENLAQTHGDAECIVNIERNRRYTFREYHRLTNRIANMMIERLNLRRGDYALAILNNDSLSIISHVAVFKGEACMAYTNTTDSLADQARQLDLIKPKVVFIETALLPSHHGLLKERGITIVSMDAPGRKFADVLNFNTLLKGVGDHNPNVVHDDRNDCMYLRFTGGTTGAAKAVMYSIDNWMASRDIHYASGDDIPLRGARMLHFGMMSHASGIVTAPIMLRGGCNITMNDRSMLTWCKTVEAEEVTHSLMVPSMLYRLLDAPEAKQHKLTSLQTIYYGASPMLPARLKQLTKRFGNVFVQLYGSSEHSSAATAMVKSEHLPLPGKDERHLASAGRVVSGVEVRIMGRDGKQVADGQDGEIWLRSRAICLGYLHAPQKTAEEFVEGFWKSGDFGRIDSNGFLYVLDRVKDTILHKGKNVYPSQVEAALCFHAKVQMAAVVGIADEKCNESVHAEVILRPGATVTVAELRKHVAGQLPAKDVPSTINFVSSIPLSPVGKVLRRSVRDACAIACAADKSKVSSASKTAKATTKPTTRSKK